MAPSVIQLDRVCHMHMHRLEGASCPNPEISKGTIRVPKGRVFD